MKKIISVYPLNFVSTHSIDASGRMPKGDTPVLKEHRLDHSLVQNTNRGAGFGAALFGPFGALLGSVFGGAITQRKDSTEYRKYTTELPTFKKGAKSGAIGSLVLSIPLVGIGIYLAIAGSLSLASFGIVAAVAVLWTALSALAGGVGHRLVRYAKKPDPD